MGGGRRSNIDFVLENRGIELRNVRLKSDPDYLGWANIGEAIGEITPKATSEYFEAPFPYLHQNYRRSFFWCDAAANKDILAEPLNIAQEMARARETLEKIGEHLEVVSVEMENPIDKEPSEAEKLKL